MVKEYHLIDYKEYSEELLELQKRNTIYKWEKMEEILLDLQNNH